uniref:Uncharacterized protein n=1 Tax=Cannabis sativa TaxID=3483 RepID=A0A803NKT6_CANSA
MNTLFQGELFTVSESLSTGTVVAFTTALILNLLKLDIRSKARFTNAFSAAGAGVVGTDTDGSSDLQYLDAADYSLGLYLLNTYVYLLGQRLLNATDLYVGLSLNFFDTDTSLPHFALGNECIDVNSLADHHQLPYHSKTWWHHETGPTQITHLPPQLKVLQWFLRICCSRFRTEKANFAE